MIYMYSTGIGVISPGARALNPVQVVGTLTPLKDLKLGWPLDELVTEIRTRLESLDHGIRIRFESGVVHDAPIYIKPTFEDSQVMHTSDNVIISVEDILFRVIEYQRYRKGSVFIALQLSQYGGGRLRLIGYTSDYVRHGSVSTSFTGPGAEQVNEMLNGILKYKDNLLRQIEELRNCNPNIIKPLEKLFNEMIIN